jgi:hypothetical protein
MPRPTLDKPRPWSICASSSAAPATGTNRAPLGVEKASGSHPMTENGPVAFPSRRSASDDREGDLLAPGEGMAIEIHIPWLRRYACALTRDAEQADDLVQDCLERAVDRLRQFQRATNLRAWLFTVLRNIHFAQRCREARRAVHLPLEDWA